MSFMENLLLKDILKSGLIKSLKLIFTEPTPRYLYGKKSYIKLANIVDIEYKSINLKINFEFEKKILNKEITADIMRVTIGDIKKQK